MISAIELEVEEGPAETKTELKTKGTLMVVTGTLASAPGELPPALGGLVSVLRIDVVKVDDPATTTTGKAGVPEGDAVDMVANTDPASTIVRVAALPLADATVVIVEPGLVIVTTMALPAGAEGGDPAEESVKVETAGGADGRTVVMLVEGPMMTTE